MAKIHSSRLNQLLGILAFSIAISFLFLFSQYVNNVKTSVLLADASDATDIVNQQNQLKNQSDNAKRYKTELKDIQRDLKTANFSKVNAEIANFEVCLTKVQSLVGNTDFWDAQRDCDDYRSRVDDIFRDELRPQRECAQQKKNVDERKKEKKNNIDRQTKDITKQYKTVDISALNALTVKITGAFATADTFADKCDDNVVSTLQDVNSDLNTYFQDWYSLSDEVRNAANDAQKGVDAKKEFEKNISRQCTKEIGKQMKNFERDVSKAGKSGIAADQQLQIQSVRDDYKNLCTVLQGTMQTALKNGDLDAFDDAKNEFYSIQQDFWSKMDESRNSLNEENQKAESLKNVQKDLQSKEKELKKMDSELNRLKKTYAKTAKKYADSTSRKEALVIIANLISRGDELKAKMSDGINAAKQSAPTDPDSYWYENNEALNDLQEEFREIQNSVNTYTDIFRNLQEVEKTIKNDENTLKTMNISDDKRVALGNVIKRAREYLAEAWVLSVKSPEDAMSVFESLKEIGGEWDEILGEEE